MRRVARTLSCAAGLLVAHLLAPGTGGAQVSDARALVPGDTVTVVAGERYAAGGLKARLLGRDYRDVWATPIRVPVLDLGTFGGGLTPVQRGAGLQTISLRFVAPDGREYNFRSVDKDQTPGLHPDFQETLIDRIAQDQVSSKHPASALIAGPLLDAAGLMHPGPALYVMPDDPRLGEFRETFAGMLGMLERHPDEGEDEDHPLFHGALRVAGTDRLLEHLEESSESRVDDRVYLRARLIDMLMGDWDRHVSQWRWARYDRDDVRWWLAVPEDRDNAFSSYDGLLLDLARGRAPHLAEYGPEYPGIFGLTTNAQVLDRRLLAGMPRAAFDSTAAALRAALTDEVIDRAVASTPPEYAALRGEEIAAGLRGRRDALPAIATAFYEQLAGEVEIRGTDERDLAIVDRLDGGFVRVRLHGGMPDPDEDDEAADDPYFTRLFDPSETREVRIFLHGEDDRAVVRGNAPSGVLVRVIGGGSDDVLADSSTARGGRPVIFYDDRGDNAFVRGPNTVVDTRAFEAPDAGATGFNENAPAYRDWGRTSGLEPSVAWRYNLGPVVGVGRRVTRYGFRRAPYAHSHVARVLWAPLETRFGIEAEGDIRHTNSLSKVTYHARASQLAVTRFHGYGNDTPGAGAPADYKIVETEIGLEPLYHLGLSRRADVFAGPVVRYTWPDMPGGSPAALFEPVPGTDDFLRLGAQLGMAYDGRDLPSYPRRGARARVVGSGFADAAGLPGPFGTLTADAAGYVPVPFPLESTLAVRVGARRAWGDFPVQEAAFVGGTGSIRGSQHQRWAGDAAAFGGAELRTFLTRFNFISRGDLGVIALADAGRVYVDGESPGGWHTSVGGGLWLGILDRTRTLSIVAARGEETAVYITLGMPF